MQLRFLLGPAGSGKTFRCLSEVRRALLDHPEGPPLVFVAPKQATFQIERQLLAGRELGGYARLQILSFERLAEFVLGKLGRPEPELLSEEGRVMVLRALLARERERLQLFQTSARMPGFARRLSELLRELQRHRVGPDRLERLASSRDASPTLSAKLADARHLLCRYAEWLGTHGLDDAERLLDVAAGVLREPVDVQAPLIESLWLDGFAEMTPQELDLLDAVVARCGSATLAFCLDQAPPERVSLASAWGLIGETFRKCHARLRQIEGATCQIELLQRDPNHDRFADNPVLRHVESNFARPRPAAWVASIGSLAGEFNFDAPDWRTALASWQCSGPEAEALAAAKEIVRHVRRGGRYRDVAVLGRSLDALAPVFRRVFRRYGIPCFVDQRAPVSHHPLAELTRSALRTLALGWRHEDWFGVLKSGLVGLGDWEADRLENAALANGWQGDRWRGTFEGREHAAFELLRKRLVGPVLELELALGQAPSGRVLATGLRNWWSALGVDAVLTQWDDEEKAGAGTGDDAGMVHATVGRQLNSWLDEIARAFPEETLGLSEWLPVLESALGGLTVGRVPPALDQVLIGSIDRSRNPDLQIAILPGWNDGVFPMRPSLDGILSETERESMALAGVELGPPAIRRIGHERFYAYIALTRARARVVVTWSTLDSAGVALTPSPFLGHLRRLFPEFESVQFDHERARRELDSTVGGSAAPIEFTPLHPLGTEALRPLIAAPLYGSTLHGSVSQLERFAACPFLYFAKSGLRLDEREEFELDARERGNFQHEVLARFHRELAQEGLRWRDIGAEDGRRRVRRISQEVARMHRGGLLNHTPRASYSTRHLSRQLEWLVAEVLRWMPGYGFDPADVEVEFGGRTSRYGAWRLDLGDGRSLMLRGKIDRIDTEVDPQDGASWAVVFDYKTSAPRLDLVLAKNGIQMQLPVYAAALEALAGQERLPPQTAGIAYAALRPVSKRRDGRNGEDGEGNDKPRFEVRGLLRLDQADLFQRADPLAPRTPFVVKVKKDGLPAKGSHAMVTDEFEELLEGVPNLLVSIGRSILGGTSSVSPYRKGSVTACDHCEMAGVCRIDPATAVYRRLA